MKKGGDEDRNGTDEQTAKMNADEDRGGGGWGDEIKGRQGEDGKRERERDGKKNSQPRLKYLRCHLCWRMTPLLCNKMGGGGMGCIASPEILSALNIALTIFFSWCCLFHFEIRGCQV